MLILPRLYNLVRTIIALSYTIIFCILFLVNIIAHPLLFLARKKVRWQICQSFVKDTIEEAYGKNFKTWNNYRILTLTDSSIKLPTFTILPEEFITFDNPNNHSMVDISILYDILNNLIINGDIEKPDNGYSDMFIKHIEFLKTLKLTSNTLIMLDDEYFSTTVISFCMSNKIMFLMRVESESIPQSSEIEPGWHDISLSIDNKEVKLQLAKLQTSANSSRLLLTNLSKHNIDIASIKKLYFKRWSADPTKNGLRQSLEINGLQCITEDEFYQEFYLTFFIKNTIFNHINNTKIQLKKQIAPKNTNLYIINLEKLVIKYRMPVVYDIYRKNHKNKPLFLEFTIDSIKSNITIENLPAGNKSSLKLTDFVKI
jgi:hypothetical protein